MIYLKYVGFVSHKTARRNDFGAQFCFGSTPGMVGMRSIAHRNRESLLGEFEIDDADVLGTQLFLQACALFGGIG